MVWFVRPLELLDDQGKPSGKWHLTATSDEGGGFWTCSEQEFDSAEAAQADPVGRAKARAITGIDDDIFTRPIPNHPAVDEALRLIEVYAKRPYWINLVLGIVINPILGMIRSFRMALATVMKILFDPNI